MNVNKHYALVLNITEELTSLQRLVCVKIRTYLPRWLLLNDALTVFSESLTRHSSHHTW